MNGNNFFLKQTPSSKIKAKIVSEYFPNYCKIISRKFTPAEIRFIDLFSGPGIYEDGNPSTPILIGSQCKEDNFLKNIVRLIFNDKEHIESLKKSFEFFFPEGTFPKSPRFGNKIVGEDDRIKEFLMTSTHKGNKNEFPSLLFIDPFGYKGIETKVLAEFMRNWGNEIFLFVNTKRIHPALENEKFDDLMKDLFPTTLEKVRKDRRYKSRTSDRINLIIECLAEEYKNILGGEIFHTAFKFKEEDNEATSHYILHLTKHSRGYDLVKQIYTDFANVGTIFDGANTYTFDAKKIENEQVGFFDIKDMNIDRLKDDIEQKYKGKKITAIVLFDEHQKTSLYSRQHYSAALRKLVNENRVSATFTDNKNHKVTVLISKDCLLNFN